MNLTPKQKIVGVVTAVLALLGVGVGTGNFGSVAISDEYQATSTAGMSAGFKTLVSNNPGTLGSIVVASSSATTFKVWNATSTTDTASTTVTQLKAAVGEGAYTFDVALDRGVIVELPSGWNGSYTVTFRQR